MVRQRTLQSMFTPITKEEMEVCVQCDFATLEESIATKMELEKSMAIEVVKVAHWETLEANLGCLSYTKGGDSSRIHFKGNYGWKLIHKLVFTKVGRVYGNEPG